MLSEKEKKQLQNFEQDLAMPAWKYVLIYGLGFAILLTIFSWVGDIVFDGKSIGTALSEKPWRHLITIPFGAISFGVTMRWIASKQYKKLKKKEAIAG